MNLVYYDLYANDQLESFISEYSNLLVANGEAAVSARRLDTVEDVLRTADVVSVHTVLDETTRHLVNAERLALMKSDAIRVRQTVMPSSFR